VQLAASGVVMRFKGLTAVDGVDLAVDKGEIVGLIGPNGSGKTTLLNVISGVLHPTSGEIRLGDRRWPKLDLRDAARLGIRRTFQNIRLAANLTALETVEVAAAWLGAGDRQAVALAALGELDFLRYRDRFAAELAYGLQRRLEIARAIAGRLEFLMLDEPTAGLNREESQQIVDIVCGIRDRRGCGIILIDHDLNVIMNACDRVVVLNEGKVIGSGRPEEVRRDPAVIRAYLG
jgi:ABC-type branched-subunit amino acid transport system ATPase component